MRSGQRSSLSTATAALSVPDPASAAGALVIAVVITLSANAARLSATGHHGQNLEDERNGGDQHRR